MQQLLDQLYPSSSMLGVAVLSPFCMHRAPCHGKAASADLPYPISSTVWAAGLSLVQSE